MALAAQCNFRQIGGGYQRFERELEGGPKKLLYAVNELTRSSGKLRSVGYTFGRATRMGVVPVQHVAKTIFEMRRCSHVQHIWVALGGGDLSQEHAEKAAMCAKELEARIAATVGMDKPPPEDLDTRREIKEIYFELAYKVKRAIKEDTATREACFAMSVPEYADEMFPYLELPGCEEQRKPRPKKSASAKKSAYPPVGTHPSYKPQPRTVGREISHSVVQGLPGPGTYTCDAGFKVIEPTSTSFSIRTKCPPAHATKGGISANEYNVTPGPDAYAAFTQYPEGPHGEILRHSETTRFQATPFPKQVPFQRKRE
jgi:hypothetical protein